VPRAPTKPAAASARASPSDAPDTPHVEGATMSQTESAAASAVPQASKQVPAPFVHSISAWSTAAPSHGISTTPRPDACAAAPPSAHGQRRLSVDAAMTEHAAQRQQEHDAGVLLPNGYVNCRIGNAALLTTSELALPMICAIGYCAGQFHSANMSVFHMVHQPLQACRQRRCVFWL
jgi:hypothetical protein